VITAETTLLELENILVGRHRARAIVVQFFAGSWQAGIQTSAGLGPTVKGETPLGALINLVETLDNPPRA
jgi:hypothetical protein